MSKTTKLPQARSEGEETLALYIRAERMPVPEREYRFHPTRQWMADFAWPAHKIAVEVEGAAGFGRHTRREGFKEDMRKYNSMALMGWLLLRFDLQSIKSGDAIRDIKAAMQMRSTCQADYVR